MGWDLGVLGVKNFSVRICDGASSTAHSSIKMQYSDWYCYALPVSQMSCSLASICIDDPRKLTFVCDCGSRGHTVS